MNSPARQADLDLSDLEAGSPSWEVEGQKEDLALPRNQHLEELAEGWWYAKKEGGRGKLLVKGGVTSTASGSQIPYMSAGRLKAQQYES